jgi:hypothetical protein
MDTETSLALLSLLPIADPPNSTANERDFSHQHLFCFFSLLQFINGIVPSATSFPSCEHTVALLKLADHTALEDLLFQFSFYFHRSRHLHALTVDEILSCESLLDNHLALTYRSVHQSSRYWCHEDLHHSLPITLLPLFLSSKLEESSLRSQS